MWFKKAHLGIIIGKRMCNVQCPLFVKKMKEHNIYYYIYHAEMNKLHIGLNMHTTSNIHWNYGYNCEEVYQSNNLNSSICYGSLNKNTYPNLISLWELVVYLQKNSWVLTRRMWKLCSRQSPNLSDWGRCLVRFSSLLEVFFSRDHCNQEMKGKKKTKTCLQIYFFSYAHYLFKAKASVLCMPQLCIMLARPTIQIMFKTFSYWYNSFSDWLCWKL